MGRIHAARRYWVVAATAGALLGSVRAARAQSSATPDSERTMIAAPRWKFGGWIAGATGQPLETRIGHVHDRDLFLTALRASHPILVTPRFRLRSTVDLFPLVVATANRDYTYDDVVLACTGVALCQEVTRVPIPSRHTAYAAGIAPLGFEGLVTLSRRVGLGIGVEGGGLYFNRRIPDPGETRFNFMADGNVALRVSLGVSRPTLIGGFRINHISNGGTGNVNPGMDSRLLFVGLER